MANTLARYKTILSLSLALAFLIIAPKCFAYNIDFDDYSLISTSSLKSLDTSSFGYSLSQCQVSTAYANSVPNSVHMNSVSSSANTGCTYTSTSSSMTDLSFKIYVPSISTTGFDTVSYISLQHRVDSSTLTNDNLLARVYIRNDYGSESDVFLKDETTGSSVQILGNASLSVGWHTLKIHYNPTLYIMSGQWDSFMESNAVYVSTTTGATLNSWTFTKNYANSMNLYIDDVDNGLDAPVPTENSLSITQPVEGQTYSLNPMNFLFEYVNIVPYFWDKIMFEVNRLSVPQMSITPIYADISTTTSGSGVKSLILSDGDYQVRAFWYNSSVDLLGTSTPYVNFTISSSTVGNIQLIDTVLLSTSTDLFASRQLASSTIHGSVCSAEEWATPDPVFNFGFATTSVSFLNLTKVKCVILDAAWNFGDSVSSFAKTSITKLIDLVKMMFPFNLFVNFYDCWQDSSASLPDSLSVISDTVDADGNITLLLPEGFGSTTAVIWGTSAYTGNTRLLSLFAFIRALSTWLMWGAFIYMFWRLGETVYDDLQGLNSDKTK